MTDAGTNMTKRRLGKTDLQVTALGFGGIPIQRANDDDAVATVRRAYDLGISFFDTARGYSTSEDRIGRALEGRDYIVATKSGARDADAIMQDVERSLTALRRSQIDLYQLHGVNDDEQLVRVLAPGGAVEGLRRARDGGMIAHIGITGHRRETLVKAIKDCDDFATVQVPFNVVEQEALETLVPLCARLDRGVIAMKPVGGGNFTRAPLAVKWCINQPIATAIPGMETVAEVEENVAALARLELTPEERADCDVMKAQLGPRICRRCGYCEPCPNEVQITMLLHGRTIVRRMGVERFKDWGSEKIIASAEHCAECRECVARCPYSLEIPELIHDAIAFYETFPELRPG